MRTLFIFVVMVILLVLGWLFSAANASELSVNYLLGSLSLRASYWLLLVFVLGMVAGVLYVGFGLIQARLANRRLRDRLVAQETELQKLQAQLAHHTGR